MDYPFWDAAIGYGMLMAIIAVVHVFVSHFAIGGGLYLVVAEMSARRAGDTLRLEYLQRLTKFFVLTTLVFGALTGVAIWFIIGLLNPAATEALIHNFVWGWATEWTFFVVEICAAIVYFYGWKTMSARSHMTVGWIYFGAAWLSLFVINGIIGFMLTPGEWLNTGSFWDGFFNPTFWPALIFRTGICVLLAGIYTIAVASRLKPDNFKASLIRYNSLWSIIGLAVIVPSFFWYWKVIVAEIPPGTLDAMTTPVTSLYASLLFLAAIAVVILFVGLVVPKRLHTAVAILLMALGLGFFGGFEWMRESVRKPYVIYNYMYGNAVEVAKADAYRSDGYLSHIAFRTGDDGADLFRRACRSCHTIDGYKPLKPAFDGTDPGFIAATVSGADALKGNMPPFFGTEEESALIAEHIWQRVDQRPLGEIYGLSGVELGERVFRIRCGRCHEFGGYQDNLEILQAMEDDEYDDVLDSGPDYGDGMPVFSGSEAEREALKTYLTTLREGGGE